MKNKMLSFLVTIVMIVFCGCTPESQNVNSISSELDESLIVTEDNTEKSATSLSDDTSDSLTLSQYTSTPSIASDISEPSPETEVLLDNNDVLSTFSLGNVPSYSGDPYLEINNNTPFFTDTSNTEAFEVYSPLDELGRCSVAYANICKDIMPTEPRGNIGMVKPSGWQTVKYNDLIEGNYLYNRCHLIAYELAGENANELNLITGTRYLNVQSMLRFENKVADYVNYTGNHVLYRVTPVFEDNNLIASGVLMEGYSVEDSGEGIQFCVYCYNVQPGIGIDYSNGDSWIIDDNTIENITESIVTTNNSEDPVIAEQCDYVVNTNTKKFHYVSCSSVQDIKSNNRWDFNGTREELISQGYVPCKRCNP